MSFLDSLKSAGQSLFSVAKVFSNNVREENIRSQQATPLVDETAAKGQQSLFERGQDFARDIASTVSRAAQETAKDPSFAAAKENLGKAFEETKTEVSARVSQLGDQINAASNKAAGAAADVAEAAKDATSGNSSVKYTGAAPGAATVNPEPHQGAEPAAGIVDGEVISTDDK